MVGGVLLTPGTAFAGTTTPTTYSTTTTIAVTQAPGFFGTTTLNVSASVSAGTGNPSPTSGTVSVSGAGHGCTVTLNGTSSGSCSIFNLLAGTYTLTGTYGGSTGYSPSPPSSPVTVTIGRAPVFVVASPPLTATNGQLYSYTFQARGFPAPTYALVGAPGWLSINASSGTVSGTVPFGVSSFSYSVTASNGVGSPATAGPYTVYIRHLGARISTYLSCPSKVFTGQRGSCTLYVTNRGFGSAPNVTAQIALPSQLRANYCGFFFGFGCRIVGNTAVQNLGTISPGQTRTLTVVFTARTGLGLWGWHHGFRFTVRVVGTAFSFGGFPFFQRAVSSSTAYVTIIPRGWWA